MDFMEVILVVLLEYNLAATMHYRAVEDQQ